MRFYLFAAAIAAAMTIQAAPVSPERALERALGHSPAGKASKSINYSLAKTAGVDGSDAIYVFAADKEGGFLVVPADDRLPALLGYGDTKIFDENGKTAPGFEYWIEELGRRAEYVTAENARPSLKSRRAERAPISPQCATRWNQLAPFNDLCPQVNKERCVTGCVATAMAQVMKYHNWPETGEGIPSYRWNGKNLRVNLDNTVFEWDKMLDVYGADASDESKNAVAVLMQCTGYSVEMDYDPDGSGALSIDIAPALGTYFKYDKSLSYYLRDYFNLNDWEDLIYNSLSEYGPVIYNGQAGIGGHSFVCDGYQGDGYFHFNWGWGGLSDGYFLLDVLDPEHQGIGGANGGFNFMQDVIVGIRPDKSGDSVWNYNMFGQGSCIYSYDESINVISLKSSFFNYGPGTITYAKVGMSFSNIDSPEAEPFYEISNYGSLKLNSGVMGLGIEVPELPDGRYSVSAVYASSNDKPKEVLWPAYGRGFGILTIENGRVVDFESHTDEAPDFIDGIFPEIIYKDKPVAASGTLVNLNDSPYLCYLSTLIIDLNMESVQAYSAPAPYELAPEESLEVDLESSLMGIAYLQSGEYYICMGEIILPQGQVTLLCEPQKVTLSKTSGIENIAGEEAAPAEYFKIDGLKADAGKLDKGVYIVRTPSGSRKVVVK